jgi:chromosome segregation ATPase
MRKTLVSLMLAGAAGALAGGCGGSLKSALGDTPQEQNAKLQARLDACERERGDTTRLEAERSRLQERLSAAEQDRDAARSELADLRRKLGK